MTHSVQAPSRWQEINIIWRDNRWLYVMAGLLLGILTLPAIEQVTGDLDNLIGNLVPEAVGIIFTVLILDRLAENRNRDALKTRLFNELRSPAMGQGTAALAWLKRENWIANDTLVGADLHRVNWQDAYLGDLNLQGANLNGANLRNVSNQITDEAGMIHNYPIDLSYASLRYAYLEEAVLIGANMIGSILIKAHLRNSVLVNSSLQGAQLEKVDLQDASLMGADLSGANLRDAMIDGIHWEASYLPDGEIWTVETDMGKFTNPEHPEFASTLEKINVLRQAQGNEIIG